MPRSYGDVRVVGRIMVDRSPSQIEGSAACIAYSARKRADVSKAAFSLNGFVVPLGGAVGIQARANERLIEIVKKVERGELKQDPRYITELRLN